MSPASEALARGPQKMLIALTDLFEDVAYAVEIGQLAAHLGKLLGMESDLAVLAAGIIHVENPLAMTRAAGASGTGDRRGMESVALQQGAAQQVVERAECGGELAGGWGGGLTSHLYRCYTQVPP
jgi:hypothetical protein